MNELIESGVCAICGRTFPWDELSPVASIRPALVEFIRQRYPDLRDDDLIDEGELNRFRMDYVSKLIADDMGELTALEREVVESLGARDILSENVDAEFERKLTVGEAMADRVATFGGSWAFIGSFAAVLIGWIILNSVFLAARPFDPYPFILLNLVLSCLAAIQAPVIMMSQNRVEARDRLRAQNDYKVNLKAELEIRHLHEKVDHLLKTGMQRLLEMQQIQLEILEKLADRTRSGRNASKSTDAL
jgi:uncharacterized membrane protein